MRDRVAGEEFLERWYCCAAHSKLAPMIHVTCAVDENGKGIKRFETRVTKGILEGVGGLIHAVGAGARDSRYR